MVTFGFECKECDEEHEIDLNVDRDGTWFLAGEPITCGCGVKYDNDELERHFSDEISERIEDARRPDY